MRIKQICSVAYRWSGEPEVSDPRSETEKETVPFPFWQLF